MKLEEKLKRLSGTTPSNWKREAAERISNGKSRRNARIVALRVLQALKDQNMTQAELAKRLSVSRQQVSKIVKGAENFTFETIAKLEHALGIELMTIHSPEEINFAKEGWAVSVAFTTNIPIIHLSDPGKPLSIYTIIDKLSKSDLVADFFNQPQRSSISLSFLNPIEINLLPHVNRLHSYPGEITKSGGTKNVIIPGAKDHFINTKDIRFRMLEQC